MFPQTHIQTCIVHLTRYSLSFASWQDRKHLPGALRSIYRAARPTIGGLISMPPCPLP